MSDVLEVRKRDTDVIVHTVRVEDADSHKGQMTLRGLVRNMDSSNYYVTISYADPQAPR